MPSILPSRILLVWDSSEWTGTPTEVAGPLYGYGCIDGVDYNCSPGNNEDYPPENNVDIETSLTEDEIPLESDGDPACPAPVSQAEPTSDTERNMETIQDWSRSSGYGTKPETYKTKRTRTRAIVPPDRLMSVSSGRAI